MKGTIGRSCEEQRIHCVGNPPTGGGDESNPAIVMAGVNIPENKFGV